MAIYKCKICGYVFDEDEESEWDEDSADNELSGLF